ncbi:MAG: efflux RND transporter periplasmic adaptor subunit [Acidobacteriota bacterium]
MIEPLPHRGAASSRHRIFLVGLGLVAVVLGAACGGSAPAPSGPARRPVEVKVLAVVPRPLVVTTTAVGTIEPENRVLVAAQEEGLVTALLVREGDRVQRGDVLAQLDDRQLAAQLAEAQARLVEAEGQWRRARTLTEEGLITEADGDAARAAYEVARARVEALRTRLSFTRIAAPVDGVVTVRYVELGDLVGSRAPVVELAAGRRVLRVPVSELDVVKLKPGDACTVTVDALGERSFTARIGRIFPAAERTSRQVTVEVVLEDTDPDIRPGFLARAELVLDRLPAAIVVPEPVVLRGSEYPTFVYVVEGETARVRPVTLGLRRGGQAHVISGLAAGELVVVEGASLLRDGSAVRAVEAGS